jgi:hypothetical protein
MALDARSRSSIYGKFVPILGEHDANALMSEFPSVEADELVTKQFLRAELGDLRAELRGDIAALDAKLSGDIAALDAKLSGDIAALDAKLSSDIAALDGKLGALDHKLVSEVARLDGGIAEVRAEMADRFRQQTTMIGGAIAAATALIIASMPLLT